MFERFKKKSKLTISNFVTAVDGRVIAREGTVVDDKFVNELRAYSSKTKKVKPADTLLQTHFLNLLDEPKYNFLCNDIIGKSLLADIFASIELTEITLREFIWMQRYDYQYHHSFAVTALAANLSYQFYRDRDKEKAIQATSCALTHDFGITRIPERILYKQGNLDGDELKAMQEHPVYSYLLLVYYGLDKPALNAAVSFEHHENAQQTGYPRKIVPEHEITAFVQIADVFDALISARPFRAAKTIDQALAIVTGMADEGKLNKQIASLLKSLF